MIRIGGQLAHLQAHGLPTGPYQYQHQIGTDKRLDRTQCCAHTRPDCPAAGSTPITPLVPSLGDRYASCWECWTHPVEDENDWGSFKAVMSCLPSGSFSLQPLIDLPLGDLEPAHAFAAESICMALHPIFGSASATHRDLHALDNIAARNPRYRHDLQAAASHLRSLLRAAEAWEVRARETRWASRWLSARHGTPADAGHDTDARAWVLMNSRLWAHVRGGFSSSAAAVTPDRVMRTVWLCHSPTVLTRTDVEVIEIPWDTLAVFADHVDQRNVARATGTTTDLEHAVDLFDDTNPTGPSLQDLLDAVTAA